MSPLRLLVLIAAPVLLPVAPAWAQDGGGNWWGLGLSLLFFVPLTAFFGWRQRQAELLRDESLHHATRFDEVLNTAPDGHIRWNYGPDGRAEEPAVSRRLAVLLGLFGGTDSDYGDVLERLEGTAAAELDLAVQTLQAKGIGFELELTLKEGEREVLATGVRASTLDGTPLADVVWMRDVSTNVEGARAWRRQRAQLDLEIARLRGLLDALPLPVWLRDENLSVSFCNQAYAEAVEMASPRAAVAEGRELATGEDIKEARALAARARAAGEPRLQALHLVIGGSRRLMELTETPVVIEGPRPLRYTAGAAIDATAAEEARSALNRNVAAHAALLENLPTAMAIFGADTKLTFYNRSFAALWGIDEAWLKEEPTYSSFLEAQRERRMLPEVADYPAFKAQELKRFTSLIEPVEDLQHLPDGTTLLRSLSPHPLGGLLATYEDVTDILVLESSYNTLIAVQQETLDHLNEAVAVFGSDGQLRLSNPAYARLWSLDGDDLTDRANITEILEKQRPFFTNVEDWPSLRAEFLSQINGRAPQQGRLQRSDGVMLDYLSFPLPDGGVLLTYEDVSNAAQVERALRDRNEALRAANRLKSEFIANVSYELRTPLTALSGLAEGLAEGGEGKLNPRQTDHAKKIVETAKSLDGLIEDIVDLASIEAGDMTLELDAFDILPMASEILALVRERVKHKGLTLDFDCPSDIGWMVADEKRIKQVLYNLLSNAVKFTAEGGKVTLAVEETGAEVVFSVSDSGVGIPAAERDKVFDSFARGSQAKDGSGAGLGLSIVKRFVELHGGTVELTSRPGKGTKVTFRIPVGGSDNERQLSILDAVAREEAKDKRKPEPPPQGKSEPMKRTRAARAKRAAKSEKAATNGKTSGKNSK